MRKYLNVLYNSFVSLINNEGNRIAAEASYYLMFSIAPALFLAVVALSYLSASPLKPHWFKEISGMVSAYIPRPTYEMMSGQFKQTIAQSSGRNIFIAILVFFWTSTKVFKCYMDAISQAYGIPDNRNYPKVLGVSLALTLASGVLLFLTTLVFALLPLVFRWLSQMIPFQGPFVFLNFIRHVGTFALISPSIAILYKYGPDGTHEKTHKIWPGAGLAAVLWILSTQLFGVYLEFSDAYQALSGALGGVIILLMWMYLSSLAIVFGAEFNANLGETPEAISDGVTG